MNAGRSIRMRVPGQSLLGEVVRIQSATPERSRLARILGASPLTAENRSWYRGALGELIVGEVLEHLGPEWDVLHAVPAGSNSADIDHVVIGPAGVFTINTKNHSEQDVWVAGSTFMVEGQRQPHIPNAQFEAERAAQLLTDAYGKPVIVTPVLVVVDPKKLTIRSAADGVEVVTSRQLARWFTRQPKRLSGDEVASISDVADLASTWHTDPRPEEDTAALHQDFASIRKQVRSAIRRRVLWGAAFFATAYGAVWVSLANAIAHAVGS